MSLLLHLSATSPTADCTSIFETSDRPAKHFRSIYDDFNHLNNYFTAEEGSSVNQSSIGDEEAVALSEALKINTALATLNLNYNLMWREGAIALLEALKANTALIALSMEGNSIGDVGPTSSDVLETNTALAFYK
ncbi:hypothetical protein BCR41DRAFT_418888 [Lobosporangium transversale]|uniref:Uncharacterized protein n=1 Tax=Lobosporangium transversale TaxID=64571 RepID=A0A1Y2H055_9FUNG|nr:hypothetical protein BCR41DRAFT_418888 [Lobosporangium transversale]ORZ27906.1 hypothetical protein BCR41DRAFT_418888 [Lobosporangium transversale]|eukprot:XP_021885609.1 hypothetical protein BCR41DRAFT_418888 [Lobosporangium transversale]